MFKFVHIADMHLGLGFRNVTTPAGVDLSQSALRSFQRALQLCRAEQADMLLVAGDCYENTENSFRSMLAVQRGLSKLANDGIRSFLVHGNHDPLVTWNKSLRFPELVNQFGIETSAVEFSVRDHVVRVAGVSYGEKQMEARPDELRDVLVSTTAAFKIALLHCTVGETLLPPYDYARVSLDRLVTCGADYVALGHVHSKMLLRENAPRIAYPGALQRASIRDNGPGGAWVVTVDDNNRINPNMTKYVPLAVTRWSVLELDISDVGDMTQLACVVENACRTIGQRFLMESRDGLRPENGIVRLILKGRSPIYGDLLKRLRNRDLHRMIQEDLAQLTPLPFYLEELQWVLEPALEYDWQTRPKQEDMLDKAFEIAAQWKSNPDEVRRFFDSGIHQDFARSNDDIARCVHAAASMILNAMDSPEESRL